MASTPSKMIELGSTAPDFELTDTVSGNMLSLAELKSDKATVIMFICNHCPYVKHINSSLVELANEYMSKGISFISISSNDIISYPDDSPENMNITAKTLNYPFPYLYDETQEAANAYDAACTPDFFIYDKNLKLVYRGQYDDSRPGNGIEVTGSDISIALDAILSGNQVNPNQKPSIGCNIKWKNNN